MDVPASTPHEGPPPRRCVVIGASRGIGRVVAEHLASAGHEVIGGAPDWDRAEPVSGFTPLRIDLADAASVHAFFAAVAERWDHLDLLTVPAGIGGSGAFEDLTDADWLRVLEVNTVGPVRSLRAALPLLRASAHPRVVFFSSVTASEPIRGGGPYNASKAALEAMARTVAIELAPEAITVNCVAPGLVSGGMGDERLARLDELGMSVRSATGRAGTAEEVARVVSFLGSPEAGYVSGTVVPVHGALHYWERPTPATPSSLRSNDE